MTETTAEMYEQAQVRYGAGLSHEANGEFEKAAESFRQSAAQGYSPAQYSLGVLLGRESGVDHLTIQGMEELPRNEGTPDVHARLKRLEAMQTQFALRLDDCWRCQEATDGAISLRLQELEARVFHPAQAKSSVPVLIAERIEVLSGKLDEMQSRIEGQAALEPGSTSPKALLMNLQEAQSKIDWLSATVAELLDKPNATNIHEPAPPQSGKLVLSENTAEGDCANNCGEKNSQTSSVPLDPSMWDVALLVGVQGQGHACTVWAVFAFLLNAALQATLVGIIIYYMAPDQDIDEDTAAGFRCALVRSTPHGLMGI